jgi:hypothetical protein
LRPLVLLQSSDWHVGSPLTGRGIGWPAELRETRREEVDAAPERAVAAALEAGADALVLPGDLWDAERVPPSTIHRMLEAFASFAPRPVFVAPGNHDYVSPASYYSPDVLAALGMRPWPPNVVVFRDARWTTVPFPGRDDVSVTGRAFASAGVAGPAFADAPPPPDTALSILLLHGSLETYGGPDAPSGAKRTAPFTARELLAAGRSWAALGHHHHLHVLQDESGAPRAAYAGSPTARGLDERGPRCFLKVTLDGEGPPRVETLPADRRSVHDLSLDVSGLDGRSVADAAAAALEAARVGLLDVVRLTFAGTQPYGFRAHAVAPALAARVAPLSVRDRTVPPGADAPDPRTAEGRFVADLRARLEGAPDERSRRVVELARDLGLDALRGRALRAPEPADP